MPTNSRSMSKKEIEAIVEIIRRFRSKPTWPKINKRAQKAGIEYSLRSIQSKSDIVAAYREKVTEFVAKKETKKAARESLSLPIGASALQSEILKLRAALEETEARNRELESTVENVLATAMRQGIPLVPLKRPIRGSN